MSDEMAIVEKWLSSRLTLCELKAGTVKQPGQVKGLKEVIFNTPSSPLPAYHRSSVLSSLEAYTEVLNQAGDGYTLGGAGVGPYKRPAGGFREEGIRSFALSLAGAVLQSVRSQWGTAEPGAAPPRAFGVGPPPGCSSRGSDPPGMGPRAGLCNRFERSPERLSCTIQKVALEEGEGGHWGPQNWSKSGSDPQGFVPQAMMVEQEGGEVSGGWRVGCRVGQGSIPCWTPLQDRNEAEGGLWEERGSLQGDWNSRLFGKGQPSCCFSGGAGGMEAEVDWAFWCSSGSSPDSHSPCSILAHTGLPSKGSVDYPDAPPTTPLLPEMLKSQGSFHRKLKGGLANEFLPAPPPPTPKNLLSFSEGDGPGLEDTSEFVVRLIRSLSLECSERGLRGVEEEEWADKAQGTESSPQERPKLSTYATQLLTKIISSVTANCTVPSEVESTVKTPAEHLQLVAERWANEVIQASFLEMVTEGERGWAGSARPVRRPAKPACQAIPSAVALGRGPEGVASPEFSPAVESLPQDGSRTTYACQAEALSDFAGRLIADALLQARAELGPRQVQEVAEELSDDIVAWAITMATQQDSIRRESPGSQEGSCHLSDGKPEAKTGVSDDKSAVIDHSYAGALAEALVRASVQEAARLLLDTGSEVRAFLDEQWRTEEQELQGVLLWAAASNVGIPALQLTTSDWLLQAQFSTVANRALLIGWTVGELMTSLLQYCELKEHSASRGRSLNHISLLKHLREKLGWEMND